MTDWQPSRDLAGTGVPRSARARLLRISAEGAVVLATDRFPTQVSLDGVEGDAWQPLVASSKAESLKPTPLEDASSRIALRDTDRLRFCSAPGDMARDVLSSWEVSFWSTFERRPFPVRSAPTSSLQKLAASMKYSLTLEESARDLSNTPLS